MIDEKTQEKIRAALVEKYNQDAIGHFVEMTLAKNEQLECLKLIEGADERLAKDNELLDQTKADLASEKSNGGIKYERRKELEALIEQHEENIKGQQDLKKQLANVLQLRRNSINDHKMQAYRALSLADISAVFTLKEEEKKEDLQTIVDKHREENKPHEQAS